MAKNKISNNDNTLWFPSEEFIPYACYIDKQIILTKNGCLLMTFKIPSFISNKSKADLFVIRDVLRDILSKNFKNQDMSFYFNTVREKADIIPKGSNHSYFSETIEQIWNEQNDWYDQFVNEIYITVTISLNIEENIISPVFILKSLTQLGLKTIYTKEIERCTKLLKKFSYLIMEKMMSYDLRILSIQENSDGTFYSEHMNFFSLLINLDKGNFPITFDSISDIIRTKKIAYGADIIEVDKDGEKKYASIFTIKAFNDLTLGQLDKILQLPIELVVTETATFVDTKYAMSLFEEEVKTLSMSDDGDLAYVSGISDFSFVNKPNNTEYCISQVSIMIINKNRADLILNIREFYKALDNIGLIAVKENVYLPTIFWSQLPGNYQYLKRFHILPISKIATYISLFNFPTGKLKENYWGNAITIVPTALDTPYFFNFHYQTSGNTLIVGPDGTGKTSIMNFLLSQTSKINPKIFYIDTMRSSEVFINAMDGQYYRISPNISANEQFRMNPFNLDYTPENEKFLIDFIIDLVDFQDDGFIEMGKKLTQLKSQYEYIPQVIKKLFELPKENRNLNTVVELFRNKATGLIYYKLKNWRDNEKLSFIFNHNDNINLDSKIIGVSLKTIIKNKELIIPIMRYILLMINSIADNNPFILVIDNAWTVIDNDSIAPLFFKYLNEFYNKNIIAVLSTNDKMELNHSYITSSISNLFATKIYLATPKITPYERRVFNIEDEEAKILSLMQVENRNFLLKNEKEVIISSIDLTNFGYYKDIFVSDNVAINAMKKAKDVSNTSEPEEWIPMFLKILEEYEKIVQAKRMRENEINQQKWEEARNFDNNVNKIMKNE